MIKQKTLGGRVPVVLAVLAVLATLVTPAHAAPAPPIVHAPADGALIGSSEVEFVGAVDGSTVQVDIQEGASVLAAGGTPGGGFRINVVGLADGAHTIDVVARDANATPSPPTTLTFVIDTTPPSPPIIVTPTPGQLIPHSPVTIEGTAEPHATVTVREEPTQSAFQTVATPTGTWSLTAPLGDGNRVISATATDPAGNESVASSSVTFTVSTRPPPAPVITLPSEGTIHRFTTLTVEGFAEPGTTVTITEAAVLATLTTNADSTWRTTLTFTEGHHMLVVRAQSAAGHISGETTRRFEVDITPPVPPTILLPIQNQLVAAFKVLVAGKAEPLSTVTVYRGDVAVDTDEVDAFGDWLIVIPSSPNGSNAITARAKDLAGNVSAPSAVRLFEVDAVPPTVEVSTEDGQLFLPGSTPLIEGNASDDRGVLRVELAFYDLRGEAVMSTIAICTTCPVGKDVYWRSSETPLIGRFVVKVYAVDLVGNRSMEEQLVVTIVRTP